MVSKVLCECVLNFLWPGVCIQMCVSVCVCVGDEVFCLSYLDEPDFGVCVCVCVCGGCRAV